MKKLLPFCIILVGCAYKGYYNTFYNAKEYYEKAMESTPPNKGFLDKSIQKCEKLIKYYPNCKWVPEALLLMGKCFLEKGDYDNAIRKFEELIDYYPDHPLADKGYLELARGYIKKGNYTKAEVILKKVKKNRESAVKLMIESYFFSGDYENTIKSGQNFISQFPENPLTEDIFIILANSCDSLQNFENAIKYYEDALKLTKTKKVELSITIGKSLLALNKPDDALNQLSQFQKLATQEQKIKLEITRAQCYKTKQEFEKAIEILEDIKNSPSALYEMGIIYEENLGNLEKAKEYYESAGKSGDPELRNKAMFRAGRIEKLIKYTAEDDSLQQDSVQTEEGENQFLLAELYLLEFNDPNKAIEQYNRVIQDFPASKYVPKAAYSIAWILEHESKDTSKAILAYERVEKDFPETEYAELSIRAQNQLKGITPPQTLPESWVYLPVKEKPSKPEKEIPPEQTLPESRGGVTPPLPELEKEPLVKDTLPEQEPPFPEPEKEVPVKETLPEKETPVKEVLADFKVQLGAFEVRENADTLYNLLRDEYKEEIYIENIPPYWKVRIGRYNTYKKARYIRNKFRARGYKDSWVVRKDEG